MNAGRLICEEIGRVIDFGGFLAKSFGFSHNILQAVQKK
jgi:hypothetical protein